MGTRYAESVILNLTQTWEESDTRTPLICLLSMGSDPTNQIESLSKKCHLGNENMFIHFKTLAFSDMTYLRTTELEWLLISFAQVGFLFEVNL